VSNKKDWTGITGNGKGKEWVAFFRKVQGLVIIFWVV